MRDLERSKVGHRGQAKGMNGVVNGDQAFWTTDLIKKLNFFNYQRGKHGNLQDIYEEARSQTRIAYEKRKQVLVQLRKSMKGGNQMEIVKLQAEADRYSKQYEQSYHYGQMKIFSIKNDKIELRDQYIDLHGLSKVEALNIVRMRL